MARRKDHTREELRSLALQAAEKLIVEDGIRALTTRRVATEIGYAPGTIYNIFKDVDDLIAQVNQRTLTRLNEALEKITISDNAMDNARSILTAYMTFQRTNERLWEANVAHSMRQDIRQPEAYEAELARAFNLVARALAPDEGEAVSGESQIAVRVLWASLNGIAQIPPSSRMLDSLGIQVEDLAELLVLNFMRGWKTQLAK